LGADDVNFIFGSDLEGIVLLGSFRVSTGKRFNDKSANRAAPKLWHSLSTQSVSLSWWALADSLRRR